MGIDSPVETKSTAALRDAYPTWNPLLLPGSESELEVVSPRSITMAHELIG
jgi:hypothetical protein